MTVGCTPGFAFFLRGHLWIVVAEISGSPEKIIVVSLTTHKPGSDTTVMFKLGDHDFIEHDTVVSYADARVFEKADFINKIEEKILGLVRVLLLTK
jgi:hypothetical protein